MKKMKMFGIYIVIILNLISVKSLGQEILEVRNFSVQIVIDGIAVSWKGEENLADNNFEVQKSSNGKKFKTIGIVLAPEYYQGESAKFRIEEKKIINKQKVFYRLRYVDPNGKASFSEVKEIFSTKNI